MIEDGEIWLVMVEMVSASGSVETDCGAVAWFAIKEDAQERADNLNEGAKTKKDPTYYRRYYIESVSHGRAA